MPSLLPVPNNHNQPLDSLNAIEAVVGAQGNLHLAAETLSKRLGYRLQPSELITAITSDPTSIHTLEAQVRTYALLNAFTTLALTQAAYIASLAELEPRFTAKTYVDLLRSLHELSGTQTPTNNIDITNIVLRMLPPEARQAIIDLTGATDATPAEPPR